MSENSSATNDEASTEEEILVTSYDRDDPNGYLAISVESLRSNLASDLDLFSRIGADYFIVKSRNLQVGPELIFKMKNQNISYLYISQKDRDIYLSRLQINVSKIIKDTKFTIREKAGLLSDYAAEVVSMLFSDPGSSGSLASAKNLTQEVVRLITQDERAFLHLIELSEHDHYTCAHSIGVAAYSIALGQKVLSNRPEELLDMGMAGLLHDIGKSRIDPAIINKKGPLSEEEWVVMRKHPEYGAEILRRHRSLNPVVTVVAESHHENFLSTGYPRGIVATALNPIVRIVTLADAFSAITTERSYSPPRDSVTALMLIKANLNKNYDPKFFRPFVELFLAPEALKRAA